MSPARIPACTDRDYQLTAPQAVGIAELRRRQHHAFFDPDEREIGVGIGPDNPCDQAPTFGGRHLDRRSGANHMMAGEDEAVRRHNHAGAVGPVVVAPRVKTHHRRTGAVDDGDDVA